MTIHHPFDAQSLRQEIAAGAARLIAEDGLDYASAKRKAAKQILGNSQIKGNILPDNFEIEEEVRQYQLLFFSETQPAHLHYLRSIALELMEELAEFNPFITGAVLNGTADQHSDIYLQLFTDNVKEVEMNLLNRSIQFEVTEAPHFRHPHHQVEVISFMWKKEGVHLMLYDTDDLRGAVRTGPNKQLKRADKNVLKTLLSTV